ncbi:MAG TPA: helix-turn-helix transcriptional regulator [Pyrinomonadaceae bacterium]|nr:helix-turn-helix transcriptional regulator [Pyrinomonadaceae bacterium]
MAAGQKLKLLRNRRSITVRDVEQASRRIAEAKGDKRFQISNGWLAQLENGVSEPSICKLFSLSVIYHVNFVDLLRLYDVDLDSKEKYEFVANPHLTQFLSQDAVADVHLECSRATSLVSASTTQHASLLTLPPRNGNGNIAHGYLGSADLTMYPLIRPGSLLQIDTSENRLHSASWHNEFDRPIYFVELRESYACGWCQLQENQLLIIPHHSSPASVRRFTYPREAEIVGRVIGYYTRCIDLNCQKSMRA